MTEKINSYSKCKIFRIYPECDTECYIGYTCHSSLDKRMASFIKKYKNYLSKKDKLGTKTSKLDDIFNIYTPEKCKIELVKDIPCETKKEAKDLLKEVMKSTSNCSNYVEAKGYKKKLKEDKPEPIFTCFCGKTLKQDLNNKSHRERHEKTKIHAKLLSEKSEK